MRLVDDEVDAVAGDQLLPAPSFRASLSVCGGVVVAESGRRGEVSLPSSSLAPIAHLFRKR